MMDINIIQKRLSNYQCTNSAEEVNALKEITQEIALLALSKAGFFQEAEFHGGTALRILHGLQRFSEDLDFALLQPNPNFQLRDYLQQMSNDFKSYGYEIEISDRIKTTVTVQKQFLKVDSIGKLLIVQYPFNKADKKIKIKFEVDTNPPLGAVLETKFLNFPRSFSLQAKDLPSSFSGKIHALLCRPFNKGRDWYDLIWYITHKIKVNFTLLSHALDQQGPWKNQKIKANAQWLIEQLDNKIETIDWGEMKLDVQNLLRSNEVMSLNVWTKDFFHDQLRELKNYIVT